MGGSTACWCPLAFWLDLCIPERRCTGPCLWHRLGPSCTSCTPRLILTRTTTSEPPASLTTEISIPAPRGKSVALQAIGLRVCGCTLSENIRVTLFVFLLSWSKVRRFQNTQSNTPKKRFCNAPKAKDQCPIPSTLNPGERGDPGRRRKMTCSGGGEGRHKQTGEECRVGCLICLVPMHRQIQKKATNFISFGSLNICQSFNLSICQSICQSKRGPREEAGVVEWGVLKKKPSGNIMGRVGMRCEHAITCPQQF